MTISIIIVNYNVKYFLEHCLYSVDKALTGIDGEVIVVDNNSTDGSLHYLKCKFPMVQFIPNTTNLGFAKACNEGLQQASGEYILFLNPDTIVAEDSFTKCIDFFKTHHDCGALGVKMIDGAGNFLKESKRAFPSPLTSLYKLFGLGKLFPHSKVFNRYHLGHLDSDGIHKVDVLAGAFFMVKKEVLDEVGSFDERFFMYGEDVDLSYRILQAGYANFYFPGTTIVHFKGESTRRGGLNYVRMFYNAMSIFVKKHYGGTRAGVFNFSIHIAIWLRAFIAGVSKLLNWIGFPVIDAILILLSFLLVKEVWVSFIKRDLVFPEGLLLFSFPLYTLVYLAAAYYAGLYDRYYKIRYLLRSTMIATAAVLIVYSLLPETFRFSRGIIFFGALVALVLISFQRWMMYKTGLIVKAANDIPKPYILIAATPEEYVETMSFLTQAGIKEKVIGRVTVNGNGDDFVTTLEEFDETAKLLDAREIIFCAGRLNYKDIIHQIQKLKGELTVRFHAYKAGSIVGSDTSDSTGHILSADTAYNLDKPSNRRLKRMLDVLFAMVIILSFPLQFFMVKNFSGLMKNCWKIISGEATWVGYMLPETNLPSVRAGVLTHNGRRDSSHSFPASSLQQMDYWYARNYDPVQDVKTIIKNYRWLGQ